MITVYGMASPNVTKITLMLKELGAPFTFSWVDIFGAAQFDPSFLKMNPNHKVPVMVDEEGPDGAPLTLFESGAMLLYLAEKFGSLLPASGAARYEVLKWMMLQKTGFGPMCGQYVHFSRFAPAGNSYALERYRREVMRLYGVFEARLGESAYLGGDDYSIADIALFPWAKLHDFQGLPWEGFAHLPRWLATIDARPAAIETMAHVAELVAVDSERVSNATPEMIDVFVGRKPFVPS